VGADSGNAALRWGSHLAELGWLPDAAIRHRIRRMCSERLAQERAAGAAGQAALVESLRRGPIAIATERANAQHYEVPPAFFEAVLGPRLKYSCGWWGPDVATLAQAEEAMLALTCERAGLEDGMRVLDLGCGWGSLSLWIAEHYPNCRVLGVSNSKTQREHILARSAAHGLGRIDVITADVNDFEPQARGLAAGDFDRVLSIEMFEHVRNWEVLLGRVARWLEPADGRAFLHFFCHRNLAYRFEDEGPNDWMARHFFSGGLMPSAEFAGTFARDLRVEARWSVDGTHYARTSEAWLRRLDAERSTVRRLFADTYGPRDARRWLGRWRLFFLACAELFAYEGGREWFVTHVRLARRQREREEPAGASLRAR
jgi:cyclopropane-fatty-acyl-phospholipid synthase